MNYPAAKYARIFSDLHLDMDVPPKRFQFSDLWTPEVLPEDKDTLLLIAGDLWHARKIYSYYGQSWLKQVAQRFQYIVFVLGNHDFWGGNIQKEYARAATELKKQALNNVFLLQNNTLQFGDLKLLGGTLWTDFDSANPYCLNEAARLMNDYKYVTWGAAYQTLRSTNLLGEHFKTKTYIFEQAKKDYPEQKLWVMTHHAPSYQSMEAKYDLPELKNENALYFSNLDDQIKQSEIDLWIHGHAHYAKDYWLGKTNVVANPRGYANEDTGYNPWQIITL